MSIVNAQFQDWKGNVYHFETSADMIKGADEKFAPLEHTHDDRYYTEKEIDKMADDLKKCVVDGKEKIANAINDKTNDNQMNKDNTFDELADGIRGIKSSGGSYDPYLYLCSLLDDSENSGQQQLLNHEIYRTNRNPEPAGHRDGIRIHYQGIEAGDGREYSQWTCQDKMYYHMGSGEAGGNFANVTLNSGFVPPPKIYQNSNEFFMKPGQFLFCAVGTNQNDNIIDFQKDGFIKVSIDSNAETGGKLVPLITPKQERIWIIARSSYNIWGPQIVKATIMAYQCQEAPLDINLFFKDYHAGTYILIPTYIYRDSVKKYDFPNMI